MKRIITIVVTLCLLPLLGAYFLSFFIPHMITVELPVTRPLPVTENKGESSHYFLNGPEVIKKDLISAKKTFLEINLSTMKVGFYRDGALETEVSILKRGDPQGWGGSAAGLYKVISKNQLSYSGTVGVYMPYPIKFYGKYYLHGEPYYLAGEKLIAEVPGGCIQLSNKDIKTIYNRVEEETPVLVIDKESDNYSYAKHNNTEFPGLSAKSYLVADLDSGFIFAEKNSKEILPIASLTKLMTAVIVSESVDLRKSILVEKEMLNGFVPTKELGVGKSFRPVELFYPLLIESSNDAAEILSYFLGKEKTIELMNDKAKKILMEATNFYDPSGLDPKNTSTAQDLFYLIRYILNNRSPILAITKGEDISSFGGLRFKNLINKNIFFGDPDFVGGKSGYIGASYYTGAFVFRFKQGEAERRIAIILLDSDGFQNGYEKLENEASQTISWLKETYFE